LEAVAVGLAAKVIQVLAPYVKKGFEKFAGDVGEAAAKKVKGLFETVKKRLIGDKFAEDAFERFEKDPENNNNKILAQTVINEKIEKDQNFEKELKELLKEIPIIEIIQKTTVVEGEQIGFVGKKMKGGKVTVNQTSERVAKGGKQVGADVEYG
jgi:hypothetical protein